MSFLKRVFSKTKRIQLPDPARASATLRSMVLHMKPDSIGLRPSPLMTNVWGVLMELWIDQTVVTIVSLGDGTTSMYFSSGGAILGSGTHLNPATATRELIQRAEKFHNFIPATINCAMPKRGNVRFHLLTFRGFRSIEVAESEVEKKEHPLFPMYVDGQHVITEIRLYAEKYSK